MNTLRPMGMHAASRPTVCAHATTWGKERCAPRGSRGGTVVFVAKKAGDGAKSNHASSFPLLARRCWLCRRLLL